MQSDPFNHPASSIQHTSNSLRAKKDELTESVESILNKNPDLRTNYEATILNKFIHKSTLFTSLMQFFSIDFAKNVLKHAHIHEIGKNRTLITKGDNIERILLFLSGRVAIVESDDLESEKEDPGNAFYFKEMLQKSTGIARDLKRKIKQGKEDPNELAQFKTTKAAMFELTILKKITQEHLFNIKALATGLKYTETLVTVAPSMILTVSAKIFYDLLASYMKKQKSDKISAFRKFQYFSQIQNQKLIKIVDELPMKTIGKGKFLYQEGQPFEYIYLLIQGSIKITKTIDLFKENPNYFYIDRKKLKDGKASVLMYADLSEVFNYKPKTKLVELGITSHLSIFGEEQLFSDQPIREVSAQVSSQNATFYLINLQKLEAALPEKKNFLSEFKEGLFKNQTQKKILYRQEKLSELLMCENKNNMDYFYIEDGAKLDTNRKYKISKVNKAISPEKTHRKKPATEVSTAFYNTFNFTKLPRSSRGSRSVSHQVTAEESKIMQLIHTVDLNTLRNDKNAKSARPQENRRKAYSSAAFSIDIKNPLFELGYFEKKRKQELRIEKQSRMRPIATTSSRKSRITSARNVFQES